jgi:DNA-binding response OmpR family regulator
VILDVMLPGIDGVEVCRRIRTFSDAYVLMLTARGEEIDRVVGLSVGADDYLVKPFSPRELVARVKALLRRPRNGAPATEAGAAAPEARRPDPPVAEGIAEIGGLVVDPRRRIVTVDGRAVELTALEFDILFALARDPGVVIRRSALLDALWGPEFIGDDHLVDVHVGNIRRKIGDEPSSPRFIETVRGVGYRLRGSDR